MNTKKFKKHLILSEECIDDSQNHNSSSNQSLNEDEESFATYIKGRKMSALYEIPQSLNVSVNHDRFPIHLDCNIDKNSPRKHTSKQHAKNNKNSSSRKKKNKPPLPNCSKNSTKTTIMINKLVQHNLTHHNYIGEDALKYYGLGKKSGEVPEMKGEKEFLNGNKKKNASKSKKKNNSKSPRKHQRLDNENRRKSIGLGHLSESEIKKLKKKDDEKKQKEQKFSKQLKKSRDRSQEERRALIEYSQEKIKKRETDKIQIAALDELKKQKTKEELKYLENETKKLINNVPPKDIRKYSLAYQADNNNGLKIHEDRPKSRDRSATEKEALAEYRKKKFINIQKEASFNKAAVEQKKHQVNNNLEKLKENTKKARDNSKKHKIQENDQALKLNDIKSYQPMEKKIIHPSKENSQNISINQDKQARLIEELEEEYQQIFGRGRSISNDKNNKKKKNSNSKHPKHSINNFLSRKNDLKKKFHEITRRLESNLTDSIQKVHKEIGVARSKQTKKTIPISNQLIKNPFGKKESIFTLENESAFRDTLTLTQSQIKSNQNSQAFSQNPNEVKPWNAKESPKNLKNVRSPRTDFHGPAKKNYQIQALPLNNILVPKIEDMELTETDSKKNKNKSSLNSNKIILIKKNSEKENLPFSNGFEKNTKVDDSGEEVNSDDDQYGLEDNLEEERLFDILQAAAIFIQKNWRGYCIRRQISQELKDIMLDLNPPLTQKSKSLSHQNDLESEMIKGELFNFDLDENDFGTMLSEREIKNMVEETMVADEDPYLKTVNVSRNNQSADLSHSNVINYSKLEQNILNSNKKGAFSQEEDESKYYENLENLDESHNLSRSSGRNNSNIHKNLINLAEKDYGLYDEEEDSHNLNDHGHLSGSNAGSNKIINYSNLNSSDKRIYHSNDFEHNIDKLHCMNNSEDSEDDEAYAEFQKFHNNLDINYSDISHSLENSQRFNIEKKKVGCNEIISNSKLQNNEIAQIQNKQNSTNPEKIEKVIKNNQIHMHQTMVPSRSTEKTEKELNNSDHSAFNKINANISKTSSSEMQNDISKINLDIQNILLTLKQDTQLSNTGREMLKKLEETMNQYKGALEYHKGRAGKENESNSSKSSSNKKHFSFDQQLNSNEKGKIKVEHVEDIIKNEKKNFKFNELEDAMQNSSTKAEKITSQNLATPTEFKNKLPSRMDKSIFQNNLNDEKFTNKLENQNDVVKNQNDEQNSFEKYGPNFSQNKPNNSHQIDKKKMLPDQMGNYKKADTNQSTNTSSQKNEANTNLKNISIKTSIDQNSNSNQNIPSDDARNSTQRSLNSNSKTPTNNNNNNTLLKEPKNIIKVNEGVKNSEANNEFDYALSRITIGSEQLLKESSSKLLTEIISQPSRTSLDSLHFQESVLIKPDDLKKIDIFHSDPFSDFTLTLINNMTSPEQFENISKMREKILEERHKAELATLHKKLDEKMISPKAFDKKKFQLERWITKEKNTIQKLEKDMAKSWKYTADAVKKTRKDIMFLMKYQADPVYKDECKKKDDQNQIIEIEQGKKNENISFLKTPQSTVIHNFEDDSDHNIFHFDKKNLIFDDENIKPHNQNTTHNQYTKMAESTNKNENFFFDSPAQISDGFNDFSSDLTDIKKKKPVEKIDIVINNYTKEEPLIPVEIVKEFELPDEYSSNQKSIPIQASDLDIHKEKNPAQPESKPSSENTVIIEEEIKLKKPAAKKKKKSLLQMNSDPSLQVKAAGNEFEWNMDISDTSGAMKKNNDIHNLNELDLNIQQEDPIKMIPNLDNANDKKINQNERFADEIASSLLTNLLQEAITEFEIFQKIITKEKKNIKQLPFSLEPSNNSSNLTPASKPTDTNSTNGARSIKNNQSPAINKQRGIKTNLRTIKQYILQLKDHIKQNYFNDFLIMMNMPLHIPPSERLKNFHFLVEDGSLSESAEEDQFDDTIIKIEAYIKLEEQLFANWQIVDESTYAEVEMIHIHNKLIFDCVNEALDYFRPFELNGPPVPWKDTQDGLHFKKVTKDNFDGLFKKVEDKVVDWSLFMCGFIHDKEDLVLPYQLDEESLNQIKEEGLLKMISVETYENDRKWNCFDEEKTGIAAEISHLIYEDIIQSLCQELNK